MYVHISTAVDKPFYPYQMVRTDSKEQKLDAFVVPRSLQLTEVPSLPSSSGPSSSLLSDDKNEREAAKTESKSPENDLGSIAEGEVGGERERREDEGERDCMEQETEVIEMGPTHIINDSSRCHSDGDVKEHASLKSHSTNPKQAHASCSG